MMTSIIKAKLIHTTNERIKKYIGDVRTCQMRDDKRFLLKRDDGHYILTSEVKEFNQNERIIFFKTLNSEYSLEIID